MFRAEQVMRMKRMSQAALARQTGMHPVTISQLFSGKLFPYPGWKDRLSAALGIPVDELFHEVEDQPSTEAASNA